MIAIIANPETLPEQIGHALRGPNGAGKSIGVGPPRQQPRQPGQLPPGQFGRAARPRDAAQSGGPAPATALRPLMHGLSAYAQLPGNRGQRFAPLDAGQGGHPARLQHHGVSAHAGKIHPLFALSSYLCRCL